MPVGVKPLKKTIPPSEEKMSTLIEGRGGRERKNTKMLPFFFLHETNAGHARPVTKKERN